MQLDFKCLNPVCACQISLAPETAGSLHRCAICQTEQIVPTLEHIRRAQERSLANPALEAEVRDLLVPRIRTFALHVSQSSRAYVLLALFLLILSVHKSTESRRHRHQRLADIAGELASIGEFRLAPLVNHGASRMLYARNSVRGIAISLVDLASSREVTLFEANIAESGRGAFHLIGWSDDDTYLAYSVSSGVHSNPQRVFLCSGNSGRTIQEFDITEGFSSAFWMSPNQLLMLSGNNELLRFTFNPGSGNASPARQLDSLMKFPADETISSICRTDDDRVAYAGEEALWEFHVADRTNRKLSALPSGRIEWLDYHHDLRSFLFCHRVNDKTDVRQLYRLDILQDAPPVPQRLSDSGLNVLKGQWLYADHGYAFVNNLGNAVRLSLASRSGVLDTNLFETGHIRSYSVSPRRDRLYAIASTGFSPLSIWEYDLATGNLRPIIDNESGIRRKSVTVMPITNYVDLAARPRVVFQEIPPADFSPGKTYPLLIDAANGGRWDSFSQCIANSGVYYVSIRQNSFAEEMKADDTAEDILAVYYSLIRKPYIDKSRVFLNGFSGSTVSVSRAAEMFPQYWRGIVLNNPVRFPRPAARDEKLPDVLVSVGAEEAYPVDLLTKFEEDACANLIYLKVIQEEGQGHIFNNTKSLENRYSAIARFILR